MSAQDDEQVSTPDEGSEASAGADDTDSADASESQADGSELSSGQDTEHDESSSDSDATAEDGTSTETGPDTGDDTTEGPAFEVNGKLKVVGAHLHNQFDRPIQLRGMSTHGLQWYESCITSESLDVAVDEWGIDLLRTSVYVQEGGYETKPEYFRNLVDKLAEECFTRGIYCMVDWHQLNPGDPNKNLELAKEFFEHVSSKHADKGNIIYEICNEPSGVDWPGIKRYAEQIIPIIRAHDPDGIIVVGTPRWASNPHDVIGNKLDDPNVLYTMHFYAGDHGPMFMEYVEQCMQNDVGIFVTEFGTQKASGDGADDFPSSQIWIDLLAKHQISWANWNYSDDERSGAVWKEGTCKANKWTDDQLKPAGEWIKAHLLDPPDHWPTR